MDTKIQDTLEETSVELQRANQRVQAMLDKDEITPDTINMALHLVLNVRDTLEQLWEQETYKS